MATEKALGENISNPHPQVGDREGQEEMDSADMEPSAMAPWWPLVKGRVMTILTSSI